MKGAIGIVKIVVLASLILLLWVNHALIFYGIRQGLGQLKIVWNAEPIAKVLKNPNVSEQTKLKLSYIEGIKRFGIDSLGLLETPNYSKFYDQKGDAALWVLTASEKYALKPYEWKFPIIGVVPYKGFFDKEIGLKEKKELDSLGYDTDLGTTSGWSTLGWFNDPVLSGMLKKPEGELAELILHEMTHATIFVTDSVTYNENLANFIGELGAQLYLRAKYGDSSSELVEYQNRLYDERLKKTCLLSGAKELEEIYARMNSRQSNHEKDSIKKSALFRIIHNLDSLPYRFNENLTKHRDPSRVNNTLFLDYLRYDSRQEAIDEEFKTLYNSNFKTYFDWLKIKYGIKRKEE